MHDRSQFADTPDRGRKARHLGTLTAVICCVALAYTGSSAGESRARPGSTPLAEPTRKASGPRNVVDSDETVRSSPTEERPHAKTKEAAPRCEGDVEFTFLETVGERILIRRMTLAGKRLPVLVEGNNTQGAGVNATGTLGASERGILDVNTGKWTAVPGSEKWSWPRFISGTELLAVTTLDDAGERVQALVHRKTGRIVLMTTSLTSTISPDGTFIYLQPEQGADSPSFYDIYQFRSGSRERLARAPGGGDDSYLEVTGLAALSSKTAIYRTSGEHEHRYWWAPGKPFSKEKGDHHKEQYGLSISRNGRHAVFAERDWGGLTYIVLVDLKAKRRRRLPYFGSFPSVQGNYAYFSSDPAFVEADPGEASFTQIESWSIFAFHMASGRLCRVSDFDGVAWPYGALPSSE